VAGAARASQERHPVAPLRPAFALHPDTQPLRCSSDDFTNSTITLCYLLSHWPAPQPPSHIPEHSLCIEVLRVCSAPRYAIRVGPNCPLAGCRFVNAPCSWTASTCAAAQLRIGVQSKGEDRQWPGRIVAGWDGLAFYDHAKGC